MAVIFKTGNPVQANSMLPKEKAKKPSHTQKEMPPQSLKTDFKARISHVMFWLNLSHSAFLARRRSGETLIERLVTKNFPQKNSGPYPKFFPPPDGYDPRPYWHTSTLREVFDKGARAYLQEHYKRYAIEMGIS